MKIKLLFFVFFGIIEVYSQSQLSEKKIDSIQNTITNTTAENTDKIESICISLYNQSKELTKPVESVTLHFLNFDFMRTRFTGNHKEQLLSAGTEVIYNSTTRELYDVDLSSVTSVTRDGFGSIKITSTNSLPLTEIKYIRFEDPNNFISTNQSDGFKYTFSVVQACDTDGDGIPNRLDLDSDGDGCSDAIEGGATFTTSDLVDSSMPGGNSGPGYTGTSTSLVIKNLGNTVGNTTTTLGVPTVAGAGQTVNNSQNALVNDCFDPCAITVLNPDSDGDGISNFCDLDDDNDGILDADELCKSAIHIISIAGPLQSTIVNSIGGLPVVPTTVEITPAITGYSIGWHLGNAAAVGQEMSINFSNPVFLANDAMDFVLSGLDNGSKFGNFFIVYENGLRLSNLDFSLANITGNVTTSTINGAKAFNSGTGPNSSADLTLNGIDRTKRIIKIGYTVHALTGTGTTSERLNPRVQIDCDMDGDGIPNHLDLDSDGDGCADAIEGGATFTTSDLVNSSMPGGNSGSNYIGTSTSPIIQNLGTTVGNTATTLGVPTVAGTGQTIGDSQNASVNSQCNTFCYKPGISEAGSTYPTKHGITSLGRAGATSGNWPMTRQSAWTVLESKEKGFVVNRVATTANLSNITNPVEGMMVYDEEADCLKIFTLKTGDTVMGWHCFVTPACPD